jgi:hypothetical protein
MGLWLNQNFETHCVDLRSVWMINSIQVESRSRDSTPGTLPLCARVPQFRRAVDIPRESTRHADDGDRHLVGIHNRSVRALRSRLSLVERRVMNGYQVIREVVLNN